MKKTLNEIISDPHLRDSLQRRFEVKVQRKSPTECWPWIAKAVTDFGYGRMTAGRGTDLKSHRIAYALAHNGIPDGMHVLHKCDNPKCCNPNHLFLGTHQDNTRDMMAKNRGSRPPVFYGEQHPNTKFGEQEALAIKNDKRPAWVIAAEYGVSQKTVYRIRQGRSWIMLAS